MNEETKVEKEYLKSFNVGYKLAMDLNLKAPMFANENANVKRNISALQAGIKQYIVELKAKEKKNEERTSKSKIAIKKNTKGKGFGLSS